MNDVIDTFSEETLAIIAISNELKAFYTLRKNDQHLYPDLVKKIENVIQILEQEELAPIELSQVLKDLDILIADIDKLVNMNSKTLESALEDLERFA